MEFENIGLMLDLSRGKVLKVETVKRLISCAKRFGYTYINLYVEDLITLEEYPQYGYMRGKYSDLEITEIVNYCQELEIEIYPAIQTLGHLEHFLRWDCSANLRDTGQVLNVLSSDTEEFLKVLIGKCKKLFPSNKINVGMDEAFDLGQGKLLRDGNCLSQKELYTKHLNNVVKICKDSGYEVIKIWSDMLFNIYSSAGGDGLYAINESTEVEPINGDVEIIFWNYWTRECEEYKNTIDIHHKFSNNVSMALGIHTWSLPFYNLNQLPITKAALNACDDKGIKDILFTMWGDDGSLYNLDSAIFGMYVTSQQFNGNDVDASSFTKITGLDYYQLEKISKISDCGTNPLRIIWNDPITNLELKRYSPKQLEEIKNKAQAMTIAETNEITHLYNLYLTCIVNDIDLYHSSDISESQVTKVIADLESLFKLLEKQWLNEAKLNGLEEIQFRFVSKLNRYQFLYDHQTDPEVLAIKSDVVNEIKELPENYNGIAKATKFRW